MAGDDDRTASNKNSSAASSEESPGWAPPAELDMEIALARVGGQMDLLKEIAVLFLDDLPRSLGEIHAAFGRGDAKQVEHAAHSLKGSVCNFGAAGVVAAAAELERRGRAGDISNAGELIETIERRLGALGRELRAL
jgi:two-component system sensor histidine kinase/response regulator